MPRLSEIANSGNQSIGKMYLEYRLLPKASDPRYGEEYYYYEFNPNGTMASKYVNSWLIFGVGEIKPDENRELKLSFDNPALDEMKAGLIFRKVGSTTLISDSEQINNVLKGRLSN